MKISTSLEAAALQDAASALECDLTPGQVDRLLAYVALLVKWNRVYNLTAVRSSDEMIKQHLLDSLSIIAPIERETGGHPFRLLDVGSGAGLPGVVIAAVLDQVEVTCVDAAAKKASFVRQVAADLTLRNLRSEHSRIEDLCAPPFDLVTARALASLPKLVSLTNRHLTKTGVWLAMKGRLPYQEIAALPAYVETFHVEQLCVPGLQADRCLVWMKRKQ